MADAFGLNSPVSPRESMPESDEKSVLRIRQILDGEANLSTAPKQ